MDGASLTKSRAQWEAALGTAIDTFRSLVSESTSKAWKPVPHSASTAPHPLVAASNTSSARASPAIGASLAKGKAKEPALRPARSINDLAARSGSGSESTPSATAQPQSTGPFLLRTLRAENVVVHRRNGKGADIYRAVADVPYEGQADLVPFQSLLQTPDARSLWDRLVDGGELIEQLDPNTRICKSNYRLGWPASPRDAIIISRTLSDDSTLIDVSTSLPRSPDAPAYLRPAPPCVRSHVHLMAWCIQALPADPPSTSGATVRGPLSRIKITVFWSWDLKGAWMGMPTGGLGVHLPDLIKGLVKQVKDKGSHLPAMLNFGICVEVLSNSFDPSRDTRHTEYAIVIEDEAARQAEDRSEKDLDTLSLIRGRRRLEAGIEFSLPASQGWDVQISVRTQTKSSQSSTWHATAERPAGSQRILLTIRHVKLEDPDEIVKATVRLQRVAASTGLRLNDAPFEIVDIEPRTATALSGHMIEDAASVSNISVGTASTGGSTSAQTLGMMANASRQGTPNPGSPGAINALIRRNYIYFTSLLQEPEAKWKPVTDTRGVTVMQLDSIDPTLVVYRAEATFVGVGVWDLFSTISNPGAQAYWDKGLEDAVLLSDINDLSSLWQLKTKPNWPVSARDSVTVQTAYKSPSSIHVFSFSSDDRVQFPAIPAPEAGTIRTQIDLRGWSIEALSPTTVHVTMLEQSDPKGWTSKSATPSAMVSAVAGVGEYAIKFGGPPVATRLLGAQARVSKYDHEKSSFRLEYEAVDLGDDAAEAPNVECEIRCDVEAWATSLDLVVDPPPISVSCLRRHKLSQGGGGLWLTIEHVAASLEDDLARITVRKGSSREKGSVFVNGAQMRVDVDELKGDQVKQLSKQKRTKPQRVPLDLNNAPRKAPPSKEADSPRSSVISSVASDSNGPGDTASSNGAAANRTGKNDETLMPTSNALFSDEKPRQPMTCALDVLFLLRRIHAERSPDPAGSPAGWALVSERNGLYVRRKLMESISSTVVVQRGDKVVQGLSAEDLVDVVSSLGCRSQWDDKVDTTTLLECYGNGATTSFVTTKASFPFRGRAFHLASLTARAASPASAASLNGADANSASSSAFSGPSVYFHASASFPEQNSKYSLERVNPLGLPLGKVLVDGWILETLDPYSSTNFQIPSTRCTHVVAVDYAGSLPAAVNTLWNSNLPRSILAIESFLKTRGALPSVKTPPSCVQVLGDGRDEDQGLMWVLDDPERKHLLLSTSFDPTSRTFTAMSITKGSPQAVHPEASGDGDHAAADASSTKNGALRTSPSIATLTQSATSPNLAIEGGASLSRAPSMNSIISNGAGSAPTSLRGRPSAIRADSRTVTDMLLMEVEVELRHFSKGYDVQIFSELLPPPPSPKTSSKANSTKDNAKDNAKDSAKDSAKRPEKGPKQALSIALASEPKQDLPVHIKVFDLPPSAVLAATLDPSARPRKHLIRASLPTTAFLNPIEDPLTGTKPPEVPGWYTRLQEGGAALRLVVKPLDPQAPAEAANSVNGISSLFCTPTGKVPVKGAGSKLDVMHVNQTSAMLQKEQIGAEPYAQLRRAPPPSPLMRATGKAGSDDIQDLRLPTLLRSPVLADLELQKAAPGPAVPPKPDGKATTAAKESEIRAGSDKGDTRAPSSSGAGRTAALDSAESKTSSKADNATSTGSLIHILNSYPLSRLGTGSALASSLTSVSSVTAKGSNVASTSSFKSNAEALAGDIRRTTPTAASTKASSEAAPGAPESVVTAAAQAVGRKRFSTASVIMIALIAFLLGSLCRSLLAPVDYILVSSMPEVQPPQQRQAKHVAATTRGDTKTQKGEGELATVATRREGDAASDDVKSEVERYLSLLTGTWSEAEAARVNTGGQRLRWCEIKRLVEIQRIWGKWTVVLALMRR
ncbi:hypothetical protein ACQY0O_003783 [Thecaphora frezii]